MYKIDELHDLLTEMRWMSDSVGKVYAAQTEQLKTFANFTFHPAVAVISILPDGRLVKVDSNGHETSFTRKFPEYIAALLGSSWKTEICYNVKHGPNKAGGNGRKSKPKRKGGTNRLPSKSRRRGKSGAKNKR